MSLICRSTLFQVGQDRIDDEHNELRSSILYFSWHILFESKTDSCIDYYNGISGNTYEHV